MRRSLIAVFIVTATAPVAHPAPTVEAPSATEISGILRKLILANLPNPLVEQAFNWGHQALRPDGVKWERMGILLKPEIIKKLQNDGVWRKIAVSTRDPEKTLELAVNDVSVPEAGKLMFAIDMTLPAYLKFEQQLWRTGLRLYAGETRARCKAVLHLKCESTTQVEKKPDSLFPDVVFRMRVVEAKLNYYDFVVEHTLGVGGDAAKFLGNAAHETVKQWHPSLERSLLEKANAAIVKAGDTKEVRLGLSKLLELKK
jgi:hypothetical protein